MRRALLAAAVIATAASCERSDSTRARLKEIDRLLLAWHLEGELDPAELTRRTEQALAKVRQMDQEQPSNASIKHRLGICLSLLKRYAEAEQAFVEAEGLAGDEELALVLQDRALCAMRQGQYDRALETFNRVLEIRPWQPDTRYHIGLIYERRGARDRALSWYVEELNHNNRNSKAWQAYYRLKGLDQTAGRSTRRTVLLLAVWVGVLVVTGVVYLLVRRRRAGGREPPASA